MNRPVIIRNGHLKGVYEPEDSIGKKFKPGRFAISHNRDVWKFIGAGVWSRVDKETGSLLPKEQVISIEGWKAAKIRIYFPPK